MKKFKFRFQTLLKARELAEENARKEYFQAYEIVFKEMQQWKKTVSDQEVLTEEYDQLKSASELRVNQLKTFNPLLHALKKKEMRHIQVIEKLNEILTEKKKALTEKMKQKKIMAKLKEIKYGQFLSDINASDQKLMDEVGVSRFIHEKFD